MSKRKKFHSSASLSRCFGIPPGDEGKINKLWRWWKERKHTLLLSPRSAKMNCSRPGSGNSFCNCSTAPKFPRDRLSCGHNPFNCQKCFFIPMLKTTKCTPLCTWFCTRRCSKGSMSSKPSSTATDHQVWNFVRELNLEKYVLTSSFHTTIVKRWPSSRSRNAACEPMNPAPPVTSTWVTPLSWVANCTTEKVTCNN